MKTDIIAVTNTDSQIETVLREAEKAANYRNLSRKQSLHLRLLTEEMMGMMRSITGESAGQFWIEEEGNVFELHLLCNTRMDFVKKEQLLSVSTTGKNEAARGLMGRLRAFFDQGADGPMMDLMPPETMGSVNAMTLEWRMTAYQDQLRRTMNRDERARELWDELEKSVVTHVADEIKVSVRGQQAEMIIIKAFA